MPIVLKLIFNYFSEDKNFHHYLIEIVNDLAIQAIYIENSDPIVKDEDIPDERQEGDFDILSELFENEL